ncbi:cell wall metabolism sensor histidine kinase WalK [Pseudoclavibacter sp. RFBB5]|uniref:sensor histidine kinase n=1 Tax=Pseudoclavibacter sp. RFBB5 TaxID=2080574 RepID=UPI0011B09113|nr:HAMP domain-containing sensor histidine kinase [Pseudoclavibacter sp. RFBB5]
MRVMTAGEARLEVRPRSSVRVRILASILLVTMLGMVVAGATSYVAARERVLTGVDERLTTVAESVRGLVSGQELAAPTTPDSATPSATAGPSASASPSATAPDAARTFANSTEALELVMQRLIPERNEGALGLIDGAPAFIPSTATPFSLVDLPALVERAVSETADGSVRMGTFVDATHALRYVAVPFTVGDGSSTALYLAAYDLRAELADTNSTFQTYSLVAVAALIVVGLVGWFVAGRLLRPLRELRETAASITGSNRSARIPVVGHDDVSALTATINGMLDRLDGSLTAQRQLLDDVRHELKTPITIVRGHFEILDPTDPAETRETVALALDELDRMSELIDDIEALAVSEQQGLLSLAPCDVLELTEQVHAKASALSAHRWVLEQTAPVVVDVDARRITQAWLQLADNAAKYSSAGSRVGLGSLVDARGELRLWVRDEGVGIPASAQERVFDRFGRAETGRSQTGSGLGLSIVQSIARGHGGRVELESEPGVGSMFSIVLPGADAGLASKPTDTTSEPQREDPA